MTVNIETLAAMIGAASVIATGVLTPVFFIMKKYNGLLKDIRSLTEKISHMESWNKKQQKDIGSLKENNHAQNRALLNMARSMKEKGFNHTIDDAIQILEDTILEQQSQSVSYTGKEDV